MIARTWGGRVPLPHAAEFYRHLLMTGVAEYRQQSECLEVHLWRRDADGWAYFFLSSIWRDMDAIRAYAGETPEAAVLYPGDDVYELVPDTTVTHYEVLKEEGSI